LVALVAAMTVASSASAALLQPDGTPIPVGNSLQALFDGRGETIDALNDAFNVPEKFIPSCALQFEVLQRNAGYNNSFGWYNATGAKPADADLHEFLTCNDPIGTVKVLAIKQDAAYLGGEIGFYQAVGPCGTTTDYVHIFYSEKQYNPDGNQLNPYTHLLIYNSTVVDKAFYFGWEDLLSGGDNDFDDLTTFVTGISCSGGGGACETGQLGICADGTMQCQMGMLTCVPSNEPKPEKCDALDNDCNGEVDDGDLCPVGEVCDKGNCVPACGSGEFVCPAGKVCDDGFCIDPLCVDVECPAEQKCVAGVCKAPCDGVTCPYGQLCVYGACIDPCAAITCDSDQICVAGACVEKCQCAGCDADQTCQAAGDCIATPCVGVTCAAGEYCAPDGTCKDACANAICPAGEVCIEGACVADPDPGSGGSGSGSGGSSFVGAGGNGSGPAGSGGAGASSVSGGDADGDSDGATSDSEGCGCRVPSSRGSAFAALAAAMALLGIARARRRRRR
jgi:hypothetical protein